MGIFDFLKPKQVNKRFITETAFKSNLGKQIKSTPTILNQLRNLNVTADKELQLEFFFYTDTDKKAEALSSELNNLGYEVSYGISASKTEYIITGWSTKIIMADGIVAEWVNTMCELAYKHDCEFDGWGTTPDQ